MLISSYEFCQYGIVTQDSFRKAAEVQLLFGFGAHKKMDVNRRV